MIHIALLEPEIPPNTGNIARLCAALQLPLHLIGPLGFSIEDRELKRAGLDYWHAMDIRRHESLEQFEAAIPSQRIFCISTRGDLTYTQVPYQAGDVLLFGKESRGLPDDVLKRHPGRILRVFPNRSSRSRAR